MIVADGGRRTAAMVAGLFWAAAAAAQSDIGSETPRAADSQAAFSFAILGTATDDADRATSSVLRAVEGSRARFVVHFNLSSSSDTSCADAAMGRRRALLDASAKPVVPVIAASEWADCGTTGSDPLERLAHLGDMLFGGDESLGRERLRWLRQSNLPRFHRYRENVRWQVGRVLFVVMNVPDNNNNFRIAAGRNGEFEERQIANRAWLERSFRLAAERRLAGVALFIDAAPRFSAPIRAPDLRARERDGYYEWKLALREVLTLFKGPVLLVQGHRAPPTSTAAAPRADASEHPLRDAAGKPFDNLVRIVVSDPSAGMQWLRVDVDPGKAGVFTVRPERAFDDPSGELYGRGGSR